LRFIGLAVKAGWKLNVSRLLQDAAEDSLFLQSRSPVMQRLLDNARQAAASNATILLTGESGTGKSLLARQIHLWSARRAQHFSIVDCTRLYQTQEGPRSNALSTAQAVLGGGVTGTIFLARVDELPHALQRGLARFVQDRFLQTIEGEKKLDVRIIASASRDLLQEVKAQRFGEDLFYGLNIISLRVPPLCERPTDILPLAAGLLVAAAIRNRRGDLQLSPEAAAAMTLYRWPGNVRELRNAMEAAAVLCESDTITLATLPEAIAKNAPHVIMPPSSKMSLEEMERQNILRVLAESATLEQAAMKLGINVATLWRKRKRYNLDMTKDRPLKRTPS
jgi:two-component system, NtrC family, response regulator AlgB